MGELKPCPNPWCIAKTPPLPIQRRKGVVSSWAVACGCGVQSPWADTYDAAITAWNTRPRTEGRGEGEPVASDKALFDALWELVAAMANEGIPQTPRTKAAFKVAHQAALDRLRKDWSSPIREPEISKPSANDVIYGRLKAAHMALTRRSGEHPPSREQRLDIAQTIEQAADAILNLAPVGGRGEEGSSRADLSPASRSPDQHSAGEWHMVHGRWGLFFPGEPLATPEQRQAFQAPWIAHAPLMDAARNAVVAWAEEGDLTAALHGLADAVSRHEPEALSGAQRSELSTQLRDEPSSFPQEQGGMK